MNQILQAIEPTESKRKQGLAISCNDAAGWDYHAERLVVCRAWEKWLHRVMAAQGWLGNTDDGGFDESGRGWCDGRQAAYNLGGLLAARTWAGKLSCDATRLDTTVVRAADFLSRRQRPDGQLDLSGIYSPNEAGFPVPAIVAGYSALRQAGDGLFDRIGPTIEQFLRRAGEAVLAGSAHTANHRWAAAAAPLAALHSLWPDPRYLQKIEAYLADGIDCDEDGCWYIERSPCYNMVANRAMLLMADYLQRPEFIEPVVRNLRYVLRHLQPNAEIDTSLSHRQDRAKPNCHPVVYGVARRVASLTADGQVAHLAWTALHRGDGVVDVQLPAMYELDRDPKAMPVPEIPSTTYEHHFPHTQSTRLRNDRRALTLAADHGGHFYDVVRDQWVGPRRSEDWFHLHWGDIVVQSLHLAGPLRCIQPADIQRGADGSYRLSGHMPGWEHCLHFRPGSPTVQMPWNWHHDIRVQWLGDELTLHLHCDATEILLSALHLWVRPGVWLKDANSRRLLSAGQIIELDGGNDVSLSSDHSTLRITGLPAAQHRVALSPQPAIPCAMEKTCACLSLGLRLPVDLTLTFCSDNAMGVGSKHV